MKKTSQKSWKLNRSYLRYCDLKFYANFKQTTKYIVQHKLAYIFNLTFTHTFSNHFILNINLSNRDIHTFTHVRCQCKWLRKIVTYNHVLISHFVYIIKDLYMFYNYTYIDYTYQIAPFNFYNYIFNTLHPIAFLN